MGLVLAGEGFKKLPTPFRVILPLKTCRSLYQFLSAACFMM
jgi:hypothetical protein